MGTVVVAYICIVVLIVVAALYAYIRTGLSMYPLHRIRSPCLRFDDLRGGELLAFTFKNDVLNFPFGLSHHMMLVLPWQNQLVTIDASATTCGKPGYIDLWQGAEAKPGKIRILPLDRFQRPGVYNHIIVRPMRHGVEINTTAIWDAIRAFNQSAFHVLAMDAYCLSRKLSNINRYLCLSQFRHREHRDRTAVTCLQVLSWLLCVGGIADIPVDLEMDAELFALSPPSVDHTVLHRNNKRFQIDHHDDPKDRRLFAFNLVRDDLLSRFGTAQAREFWGEEHLLVPP